MTVKTTRRKNRASGAEKPRVPGGEWGFITISRRGGSITEFYLRRHLEPHADGRPRVEWHCRGDNVINDGGARPSEAMRFDSHGEMMNAKQQLERKSP
jgi:hypothetical protein